MVFSLRARGAPAASLTAFPLQRSTMQTLNSNRVMTIAQRKALLGARSVQPSSLAAKRKPKPGAGRPKPPKAALNMAVLASEVTTPPNATGLSSCAAPTPQVLRMLDCADAPGTQPMLKMPRAKHPMWGVTSKQVRQARDTAISVLVARAPAVPDMGFEAQWCGKARCVRWRASSSPAAQGLLPLGASCTSTARRGRPCCSRPGPGRQAA